jgi:hypothetical protein
MEVNDLRKLFHRDLLKLRHEIDAYKEDENLWVTEKNISNSAGNLCLHLVGNLNTFVGKELGKTAYIRNRELEFSLKGLSKAELLEKVDGTISTIDNTLATLDNGQLNVEYPVKVFEETMTTGYFLIHLLAHLSYHLGQINYHRRLLDTASLT